MRSRAVASSFIGALLSVTLLSACGNKNPSPNNAGPIIPPNAAGTPPAATAPTASPKELEAESSLAVKRGVITLTAQTRGIRLCGSNVDLTLTDQLDGALDRAYAELGGKPIYAEVYGERGDAQMSNQPNNQSAGKAVNSFNVEELLYATATNPAAACAAPIGAFELLARGSGPSWSVEVHQDSMLFKQTIAPTEIKFTAVDTADTEGTVTYRAGIDRHVLELVITQRACRDASTNEYYAYSATARLDKQTLNGCARVGE